MIRFFYAPKIFHRSMQIWDGKSFFAFIVAKKVILILGPEEDFIGVKKN